MEYCIPFNLASKDMFDEKMISLSNTHKYIEAILFLIDMH